jgi:hypothetical protein
MSLSEDDKIIEKFEKEEKEMLLKFYDLRKTDKKCPSNAYLLAPSRLQLSSFEIKPNNIIQLNIGYKTRWSGYVTEIIRMNYDQVVLGKIYCEGVEKYSEKPYKKEGTIKIPILSKMKIVNLPINNTLNIEIKCRTLRVDSIEIYASDNDVLIPDKEYKARSRERPKNN